MAGKTKGPVPVLIASDKDDAAAYLDVHPHIDPDEVVIVTPRAAAAAKGVNVSRIYLTSNMVRHPDRVKLTRAARAVRTAETEAGPSSASSSEGDDTLDGA